MTARDKNTPTPQSDGFTKREVPEPRTGRRKSSLKVKINAENGIDWDASSPEDRDLLFTALVNDPDALERFATELKEQPGSAQIADTTVVGILNAAMCIEAICVSVMGPRIIPVLKHIPMPVAIKTCVVSHEDVKPIMEPARRVVAKYTPERLLQFQDELLIIEHLGQLGAAKFAQCVKMAMHIEQLKRQHSSGPVAVEPRTTSPGHVNGEVKKEVTPFPPDAEILGEETAP